MKFGVPNQRAKRKTELFPDIAVLTVGIDGGKGKSRPMILNAKAIELMGLESENATVAFSFDNGVFIMNGSNDAIPDEFTLRLTKGNPRKVSEKRTYEHLSGEKVFGLDNSVENHMSLTAVDVDVEGVSVPAFQIGFMPKEEAINEPVENEFSLDEEVKSEAFTETD